MTGHQNNPSYTMDTPTANLVRATLEMWKRKATELGFDLETEISVEGETYRALKELA